MENQPFQKSENVIRKPYRNLGQMKAFWSKNAKGHPKTLKKHYLEKVFVSRFREVKKPYKTNGKSTFPEAENAIRKPYENLGQMKEIWSKFAKWPPKTLKKH